MQKAPSPHDRASNIEEGSKSNRRRALLLGLKQSSVSSSDGQTIILEPYLLSPEALEYITDNREQFDGELSTNVWKLIFWLYRTSNDIDSSSPVTFNDDPFIEYKVKNQDVLKLIGRLPLLYLKDSVLETFIKAYVAFSKGTIDAKALLHYHDTLYTSEPSSRQRDLYQKLCLTLLDKCYYLRYKKHLPFAQELLRTVLIQELLEHGRITFPQASFHQLRSTLHNEEGSSFLPENPTLKLRDSSLSSLNGWQTILNNIQADSIYAIDLSNNCLQTLDPLSVLTNFKALTVLRLDHNKLKTLPLEF